MNKAIAMAFAGMMGMASMVAGNIKVGIAGDSTVANYKEGDIVAGWGQELKLFLKDDVLVANCASCGRSTKTFLSEGRWTNLLKDKPSFVLIQFGHNDSHAKDRPEATDASTDFKDYLRQYVDTARAAGATPIFVTPVHRRLFSKGALANELASYADAMKEVAAEKEVFLVDLHEASGKLLTELGEKDSVSLYCKPDDRSHFSPEGAYRIAGLVAEALKGEKSPMKDYVRTTPVPFKEYEKKSAYPSACLHVYGVNAKVAVTYDGGSDGVSGEYASWMKENAEQRLIVNTQPSTSEWVNCHFKFTPKTSGVITLILMGGDKRSLVCYDDIEVTGATLVNGDFETAGANNLPDKWSPLGSPVYDAESGKAHSGKAFAKCSDANRLNANLSVEAGKQVTVSFWIKADDAK